MELLDCFEYLTKRIRSVVISTVNGDELPEARVIGLLGCDEGGVYFSTGVGKNFHTQLLARPHVVITGMSSTVTFESVSVTIRGLAREMDDPALTDRLLHENPDMLEIYPTEASRATVRVFYVDRGELDWYDLTKKPLERQQFTFGGAGMDPAAKRSSLLARLATALVRELGLDGVRDIPADDDGRAALVESLLAEYAATPLSADLLEILELYRAL